MGIVIIDTGCANLSSVKFAFDRLGVSTHISKDKAVINSADKLILPGVGTAAAAMDKLHERGLVDVIKQLSQPVLGICLGMQLLTQHSDEGDVATLRVIDTRTQRLDGAGLPLPHMGWNAISFDNHPLFDGLSSGCYVYFVHSYGVAVGDKTIARCTYGASFSAAVACDNFIGVQFHPEKSGKIGAKILQNFVEKFS